MMQPSLIFLLCQSAILLVLFEGIVCLVLFDFVIENFGTSDNYSNVIFHGSNKKGEFVFIKGGPRNYAIANDGRQHVVRVPDILDETLKQEDNCPKIVSFSVQGVSADYNIKFKTEKQANIFATQKALPSHFKLLWARIYSNWRPVIMAYDHLDDGDIGFKLVDNGDYPDIDDRLEKLPYLFKRSDIRREIRTKPPQTLYLRNITNYEDYVIMFKSTDNLRTFLELFPRRRYDDCKTASYYFIPCTLPHDMPESYDASKCDGTSQ